MSAAVDEYEADGLVKQVSYGNGARVLYEYDHARRLTKITHQRNCNGPTAMLTLEYDYTPDGLIQTIEETDAGPGCTSDPVESAVAFTYDNRNRLIGEQRTGGAVEYDIGYAYDQNGNRVLKTIGPDTVVQYDYDVDDPEQYGSKANRLMEYTVVVDSQEVEKVRYAYDGFGHAGRIVRHDLPADEGRATNFYYSTSGRLWMVLDQEWEIEENEPVNCRNVKLREFRYDTGRRRYLVRERAVTSPFAPLSSQWTDYDGDAPWLDYTLSGPAATALAALDNRVALIQALIRVGLEAVNEPPQQEVTALAGVTATTRRERRCTALNCYSRRFRRRATGKRSTAVICRSESTAASCGKSPLPPP
jgi:hypothetical protein